LRVCKAITGFGVPLQCQQDVADHIEDVEPLEVRRRWLLELAIAVRIQSCMQIGRVVVINSLSSSMGMK